MIKTNDPRRSLDLLFPDDTGMSGAERFQLLANAMPQIVYVSDPHGGVTFSNDRWYEYTGMISETKSGEFSNFIHPADREAVAQAWAVAVEKAEPFELEFRIRNKEGAYEWHLSRAIPMFKQGHDLDFWIGTSTNIDSSKRAAESLMFLSEASRILGSSLDYQTTLRSVAKLAVPRIADWCAVDMIDEEGNVKRLAVEHIDPSKIKLAAEIEVLYPSDPEAATGVPQVLRTGETEFYPYIPPELLRAAAIDKRHEEMIFSLGLVGLMVVPLKARDFVIGAITFASAESGRRYTAADVAFAEDVARRAAMAVDNAWLFRKAQDEILERAKIENVLRESETRFRKIFESELIGIIFLDKRGKVTDANNAFLGLTGYSREDVVRGKVQWEAFSNVSKELLDNQSAMELQLSGKAGTKIDALVGIERLEGVAEHAACFILDITTRKHFELALQLSETRFRTMIEQSPLSIQIFDLEGNCLQANHAWEELWNTTTDSLKGYNVLRDPQVAEKGMLEDFQRAFRGQAVNLDPVYYNPEEVGQAGRGRWIRAFIYPVRDIDGTMQEVALILEDVTDRIESEAALLEAKESAEAANRAKDHFLAILSHELRTPLTPVLASIQALEFEEEIPESQKIWIEIIHRNVELEARLIDDLLDLTRISKGKLQLHREQVEMHNLINQVLDMYRPEINEKQLQLEVRLQAENSWISADPARIQQVFWNLLKNAVKFTQSGGTITIRSFNHDSVFVVEVRDNGIGIEAEVLPRIFDAFEQGEQTITRHFGGLGLGLAISKTLVDMHSGTLEAISEGRDKGAMFRFALENIQPVVQVVVQGPTRTLPAKKSNLRVLLVEDHEDTSTSFRLFLEKQGFVVKAARSVREGLEIASRFNYDLLISDLGLPDGDGNALLRKLRETSDAPAIAVSGFGSDQDIMASRDAGFAEHMTKPINFQALLSGIERLFPHKGVTNSEQGNEGTRG